MYLRFQDSNLTEEEFSNYFLSSFSLIFMQQFDEPFKVMKFLMSSDLSFFLIFGRYFAPWIRIRIFLRIRIKEAKMLQIQRILYPVLNCNLQPVMTVGNFKG